MKVPAYRASGGFFLLLALLNYLDKYGIVPLAMIACILHELGHYAAIRALGGDIKQISFTVIGAEMRLARMLGYQRECAAALAGPAVNLLLAWLFCGQEGGEVFSGVNMALGVFNLLPVRRLDGGRALHCVLCLAAGPDAAERAGERVDIVFTALILAAGILALPEGGNITLLCVALWLAIFSAGKCGE